MAPHPLFFLVRPGVTVQTPSGPIQKQPGSIVPLIAVDELPDWIDIVGAPRELTVQQTIGLSNLGSYAKGEDTYPVLIAYATEPEALPDTEVGKTEKLSRAGLVEGAGGNRHDGGGEQRAGGKDEIAASPGGTEEVKLVAEPLSPSTKPQQQQSQWQTQLSQTNNNTADVHLADRMRAHWNVGQHARNAGLQASIHNRPLESKLTPPITQQPLSPQTDKIPAPSPQPQPIQATVDEYCRHWCHYGTCKWGQQCRYKHSMPTTPSGLVEVGLSELPTWWLTKQLLGGGVSSLPGNSNSNTTSADINLAAAATALGLGGLNPFPRQAAGPQQNLPLGFDLARDYYAGRLAALRGFSALNSGDHLGGGVGVSNRKRKAQLREAVGLLREMGLMGAMVPGASAVGKRKKGREMSPLDRGVGAKLGAPLASPPTASGDVRVQQQQKPGQTGAQLQGQAQGQAQGEHVPGKAQEVHVKVETQESVVRLDATELLAKAQQQQYPRTQATQVVHGVNDVINAKTARQPVKSQQGVVVTLPPPSTSASAVVEGQKLVDV
ncbi:hypothetical protein B0T16DRAFT_56590 [Cercophora newfieldiana]|uniref:C3H1-type domain-containing protein n=1 Tax=Cercophora newfieldiana TaxID=92897 RepID=A0AA40D1N1_9PEZI|nr:hypothetical protein B0T16DRAFT_56590 [Cercophora newfieldiana]